MKLGSIILVGLPFSLALLVVFALWSSSVGLAVANGAPCPPSGITPGSVEITSSDREGGKTSGHFVRFLLCHPLESTPILPNGGESVAPPEKFALLWQMNGFELEDAADAGIVLRERAGNQPWTATTNVVKTLDSYPQISDDPYYSPFHGVVFELSPVNLEALMEKRTAQGGTPLLMEFAIPPAAGMVNPLRPGEYEWQVLLFHDLSNTCDTVHNSVTSEVTLAYRPGVLQAFHERHGGEYWSGKPVAQPGETLIVKGNGFKPFQAVRSVKVDFLELYPDGNRTSIEEPPNYSRDRKSSYSLAETDAAGNVVFKMQVPGFDDGLTTVEA